MRIIGPVAAFVKSSVKSTAGAAGVGAAAKPSAVAQQPGRRRFGSERERQVDINAGTEGNGWLRRRRGWLRARERE